MGLGARIREFRLKKNLTVKQLAEICKISHSSISEVENEKWYPSSEVLINLVQNTDINPIWLLTGEGEMFIDKPIAQPVTEDKYIGKDFVLIPMVSGKISAGKGLAPVEDAEVEMKLAFRLDWIRRKGDYTKMSLIRVEGDSMEPTLYSGDIVLVDGNRSFIDLHGGIYAILVNDSIMIKRIQLIFTEKKLKIISDNPKYEPLIVSPDDIHVIGKVIWIGREIERI